MFINAPIDDNECADGGNGGCDQICVNSLGSYSCNCLEGFSLAGDGTSCTGKAHIDYNIMNNIILILCTSHLHKFTLCQITHVNVA